MHHGASWVSLKGQSRTRRANQLAGGQVPRGRELVASRKQSQLLSLLSCRPQRTTVVMVALQKLPAVPVTTDVKRRR